MSGVPGVGQKSEWDKIEGRMSECDLSNCLCAKPGKLGALVHQALWKVEFPLGSGGLQWTLASEDSDKSGNVA